VATKLDAYLDRGGDDPVASADFEESLEAALPPDAGSQARARLVAVRWRTIVSDSAIGGPLPSS
jgi:hypothetical protein